MLCAVSLWTNANDWLATTVPFAYTCFHFAACSSSLVCATTQLGVYKFTVRLRLYSAFVQVTQWLYSAVYFAIYFYFLLLSTCTFTLKFRVEKILDVLGNFQTCPLRELLKFLTFGTRNEVILIMSESANCQSRACKNANIDAIASACANRIHRFSNAVLTLWVCTSATHPRLLAAILLLVAVVSVLCTILSKIRSRFNWLDFSHCSVVLLSFIDLFMFLPCFSLSDCSTVPVSACNSLSRSLYCSLNRIIFHFNECTPIAFTMAFAYSNYSASSTC